MPRNLTLNEGIRACEVRLIGEGGEQVGVILKNEVLNQAAGTDLDLVLIPSNTKSPAARTMDYGKYRFERQKKLKESRKKSKTVNVKGIRSSPAIEGNDFDTKLNRVWKFLSGEGTKVRIPARFKDRAITHTELGLKILGKMVDTTKDVTDITAKPKMEGRSMFLMFALKNEKDKK